MTEPRPAFAIRTVALLFLLATAGCSALKTSNPSSSLYEGVGIELTEARSADTYLAVRQARAQNAVVLQVVGDEQPLRILPLPSDDKSVFVSNLLKQSGVLEKLGHVDVTLYRPSPHAIDGLKMAVKINPKGNGVRPETDYALQPGDRLRVSKVERDYLEALLDMTLSRE